MNITLIGLDIAKEVFQLCGVDEKGKVLLKKRLRRHQLLSYVAQLPAMMIVMEACGGANHWAREFRALGHEVKLIAPQFVKPFVKGNKTDEKDAEAIAEAASRKEMRFVSAKTLEQQDWQSVLRGRENVVEMRTKLCNHVRGLLAEYGIVVQMGVHQLRKRLPPLFDLAQDNGLTPMMKKLLRHQYEMLLMFDKELARCDQELRALSRSSEVCERLMTIPGIGVITAVSLVSAIGNGSVFKNGRHFAAYVGLVPKQRSSGGREQLLGISKRGDHRLRRLLVQGARSVLLRAGEKTDPMSRWITTLETRKHHNKVCVALANKNARIALALIKSGESYHVAA